ncbi:PREDICTED: dnaJ homolog subfamily C member 4-like [Amphimedon queenslandica]|uniref:J domain-containing protein n=1 Tax=Amphimedon queenslandica TaxID=400682 RepID=A0A1X7URH3_AMPQE|nr:PREDICTED: dnaJ homolog subfamily C member 4-like [Amphimedon queenslandica]|eukprot:XP_011404288.1 PREDICTED: dnaJ homolog subfamily C member 4-like [Amphimedon queenslandica]
MSYFFGHRLNLKRRGLPLLSCRFKTFYEVLSVPKNASKEEIKDSFFTLSKKYHPDSNPSHPPPKELFIELNEAYSTLSDSSLRRQYDRELAMAEYYRRNGGPSYEKNPTSSSSYGPSSNYGFRTTTYYYYEPTDRARSPKEVQKSHFRVVKYLLLLMSVVTIVHSIRINWAHKKFKKWQEEESRMNSLIYERVREKAKNSSVEEQLLALAEKVKESNRIR